jgi:hypothetical protein
MVDLEDNLVITPISRDNLTRYASFLSEVFGREHLNPEYLDWLYFQNPTGAVVGFDAFLDGQLVGHYACVPIIIDVYDLPALLSLNTAVAEEFQGRGLFKLLALKTYVFAEEKFSCVVGVANKKSFRGFVRHLGFTHLGELELRLGNLDRPVLGQRVYSLEEISWRTRNPSGELKIMHSAESGRVVLIKVVGRYFKLKSIVRISNLNRPLSNLGPRRAFGLSVDWRSYTSPKLFLPKKFKPAPLHLIFKPLKESECLLTSWSFPDFDVL